MPDSNAPQGQDSPHDKGQKTKESGRSRSGSATAQSQHAPNQEENKAQHKDKIMRWWQRIDWSQVILDGLLLIVGIRLAYIYSGQLEQMIESNRISRTGLEAVQRAFVYMSDFAAMPVGDPKSPQGLIFFTEWENTGNTPASHVLRWQNSDIKDQPLPEGFTYPDKPPTNSFHIQVPQDAHGAPIFIAPHAKTKGGAFFITRGDLEGVNQGKKYIHFWGWVSYDDSFKCPHRTEFCQQITSYDGTTVTSVGCPEHNCIDEDCEDYQKPTNPQCQ